MIYLEALAVVWAINYFGDIIYGCTITVYTDHSAVAQLLHDTSVAGHPGRDRTLAAARRKYYWPTMRTDVEKHFSQCLSCAKTNVTTCTAPILEYPLHDGLLMLLVSTSCSYHIAPKALSLHDSLSPQ